MTALKYGRIGSGLAGSMIAGLAFMGAMIAAPAAQASYAPTLSPTLTAGSHYRLVFVTSTTTTAISTSIATYNSFVTSAAANLTGVPATTWTAIPSTSAVSALSNIACTPSCSSDPIFLLNGTQVGTSTGDLFDSSILAAINITETGGAGVGNVWTGLHSNGTSFVGNELGAASPVYGNSSSTTGAFVSAATGSNSTLDRLYAISGDLVVPAAATSVPEPGTVTILLASLLGFGLIRATRRG